MDDLERELQPPSDLEDPSDASEGNSSKGEKKLKLPLVKPMCAGEFYPIYINSAVLLYSRGHIRDQY